MTEYINFDKDLSYKVWENSSFNTSKKPNFKTFFQQDFTVYAKFRTPKIEDKGKEVYGVFSKSGLHSGCFINKQDDLFVISNQLWVTGVLEKDNISFSDPYDFNREWNEVFYSVDYTNKVFRIRVNGVDREEKFKTEVINYDNTPFYIGAGAPHYIEDHLKQYSWWYKGQIDDVVIMEKALSKEEMDLFNSEITRRFTLARYRFIKEKINRFKVWDYSGNGNHGFLYQDYNVNDIQNRILDKIKGE
jgi:hypothetical protein